MEKIAWFGSLTVLVDVPLKLDVVDSRRYYNDVHPLVGLRLTLLNSLAVSLYGRFPPETGLPQNGTPFTMSSNGKYGPSYSPPSS